MTDEAAATPDRHEPASWNFMVANMGIGDGQAVRKAVHLRGIGQASGEEVPGWREGISPLRDIVQIPRDARGIVLACGFIGALAFGIAALLVGDPLGYFFLAAAALGYFFLQTRLVPATLWLLVAAYGASGGLAGNATAWVVSGLGLLLAVVSIMPVPLKYRDEPASAPAPDPLPAQTSAFPEISGTQSSADAEVRAPSRTGARLTIRSIGRLRLLGSAADLAPALEDKPVLAFIWKYLLAKYVLGEPQVPRDSLGDEVSPGISAATQRGRVRKQLYDVRKDVDPELAALIQATRSHVWLDLSDTDFDVDSLKKLCVRLQRREAVLDDDLADEVEATLAATGPHEFLAGFEELENRVTQGRGTAGQLVANARAMIANRRADLALALAEYHDARGHLQAAIPHLQAALDAQPERQDLARLLAAAYMRSGQSGQADKVRQTFSLKQE